MGEYYQAESYENMLWNCTLNSASSVVLDLCQTATRRLKNTELAHDEVENCSADVNEPSSSIKKGQFLTSRGFLSIHERMELNSWFIHKWLYGPLLGLVSLLQFRNFFYIDGRTPWTSDQPVARPLPTNRTTQSQNKSTQTSMPWVGFEPKIPAFEQAKIVHASDRTATVISLLHAISYICWP
jgi:hypothetical protein